MEQPSQTQPSFWRFGFWIGIALLFISFVLPWVINGMSALDHALLDFAEWTSLHPAANGGALPLLPSLLLRLPLVCAAWLIALGVPHRWRLWGALIAGIIAVGLLPPPEFIEALDNANYRQQFGLAVMALIGAGVGLTLQSEVIRRLLFIGVAAVGMASSLIGIGIAIPLRAGSGIDTQPGLGVLTAIGAFSLLLIAALRNKTGQSQKMRTALSV